MELMLKEDSDIKGALDIIQVACSSIMVIISACFTIKLWLNTRISGELKIFFITMLCGLAFLLSESLTPLISKDPVTMVLTNLLNNGFCHFSILYLFNFLLTHMAESDLEAAQLKEKIAILKWVLFFAVVGLIGRECLKFLEVSGGKVSDTVDIIKWSFHFLMLIMYDVMLISFAFFIFPKTYKKMKGLIITTLVFIMLLSFSYVGEKVLRLYDDAVQFREFLLFFDTLIYLLPVTLAQICTKIEFEGEKLTP